MTASEEKPDTLSGASKTLLLPLYLRAMESQRPDALIKDEKAVELVTRMGYDSDWFSQQLSFRSFSAFTQVAEIMRNLEFDRCARDFLARNPDAAVVHIGCGLDSRLERVDDGRVEWYDLDLPDVIELRRKLIGGEGGRYHLLGYSVLDYTWLDKVSPHRQRPFLFMAEGVFMYLEEVQVKSLFFTLRDHFPGSELVFDAFSPLHIWGSNRTLSKENIGARFHWGIWYGKKIEGWGDGIRMLEEVNYFDRPEPRLAQFRLWRRAVIAFRSTRIYRFQLGKEECTQAN